MRLRNVPGSREAIAEHPLCILEENPQAGNWHTVFGNNHPIHIEVGMGKGQFITTLAQQNPEINYIGIEKYSSVLIRALEKTDALETLPENLRFVRMDAENICNMFQAPFFCSKKIQFFSFCKSFDPRFPAHCL